MWFGYVEEVELSYKARIKHCILCISFIGEERLLMSFTETEEAGSTNMKVYVKTS